ncbi:MAG: DUF288 domain-containing protein [Thaumarchaeota archaeon]|nr:DUF288 domain-containing protein [Nitrososphaerota archaeon]
MYSGKFVIITTVNPFTKAIKKITNLTKYKLVLVGDLKTPPYKNKKLVFLDVKMQKQLPFSSLNTCPYNSYQRKNIGYLYAIHNDANTIIETDDDNFPLKNWGEVRFDHEDAYLVLSPRIFNVYSEFTKEKIWPRGFPLENILGNYKKRIISKKDIRVGIWQGLVNGDPDVDAIFRLTNGKQLNFSKKKNKFVLSRGVYCPFNSQNTVWEKSFFWYLYLPVTVSFRVTDILRGYIAQRCLWEHGAHVGFTGATMLQDRNKHNLISDFESEIPCYLFANKIINILNKTSLSDSPAHNLEKIYSILVKNDIVKSRELSSVKNWIKDLNSFLA